MIQNLIEATPFPRSSALIPAIVAAGTLSDGSILAAGNLTGPGIPAAAHVVVLGTGKRSGLDPYIYKDKADKRRANGEFNPKTEVEPRITEESSGWNTLILPQRTQRSQR